MATPTPRLRAGRLQSAVTQRHHQQVLTICDGAIHRPEISSRATPVGSRGSRPEARRGRANRGWVTVGFRGGAPQFIELKLPMPGDGKLPGGDHAGAAAHQIEPALFELPQVRRDSLSRGQDGTRPRVKLPPSTPGAVGQNGRGHPQADSRAYRCRRLAFIAGSLLPADWQVAAARGPKWWFGRSVYRRATGTPLAG